MALVKICRIRRASVVPILARLRVEYAGIHLINQIDEQKVARAQALCRVAQEQGVEPILLTKLVNAETISVVVQRLGVRWLQLHKLWPASELRGLRRALGAAGDVKLIHLLSPDVADDLTYIRDVLSISEFVIIDHPLGGTGQRVAGAHLMKLLEEIPRSRTFLAGGLGPDNVAEVVRRYSPYAVDVQSGVLGSDDEQDPNLVARFVAAVRSVSTPDNGAAQC